jgi:RND family efflux transporter MFP subunit
MTGVETHSRSSGVDGKPLVKLLLSSKVWIGAVGAVVVAAVIALAYRWLATREESGSPSDTGGSGAISSGVAEPKGEPGIPKVDVARPRVGGLVNSTTQPGLVEAYNYANLFAKVSGYLATQKVDIGSLVKVGQVLATLEAPEIVQAADQAAAELKQAEAQVKLNAAALDTAKANVVTARATVQEKQADLKQAADAFEYHKTKYGRINGLYVQKAIDERAVDEEQQERDSAEAARNLAAAAVSTAQADLVAKQALEQQAEANLADARAKVQVASAALAKAKVYVGYLTITSPYDGVITERNYHMGDFIRASEQGAHNPLLTVAETDLMRIVVKMPEEFAPMTEPRDAATFKPNFTDHVFRGTVSRIANSLDRTDKTMRTEIDLPNPKNELRDGMFGYATIELSKSLQGLSIPSQSLVNNGDSTYSVWIALDGHLRRTKVKVSVDTGVRSEVVTGLRPDDLVVLQPTEDLTEGQTVQPVEVRDNGAASAATSK